jgi:peroxiredoxin Q/BCP
VQVLGVSFDDVEKNRKFAEKFRFPFPLLCDTTRAIGVAYGAADDAGASTARRIGYIIGPDGVILHAPGKVKASAFPEECMMFILQRTAA